MAAKPTYSMFDLRWRDLYGTRLVAASPAWMTFDQTGTTGLSLWGYGTLTAAGPKSRFEVTISGATGAYYLGGLPAGEYTVKFELSGMQTANQRAKVGVAQTSRADAAMRVSAVAEAITVTATAPAVAETTEVQTNFTAKTIEDLPIARTIAGTTSLAPGVNATGPSNNLMISGAASYDNVYTVDGLITDIPFPDAFADVTMSGHVYGDQPQEELAEMLRVTRPGGMVVLCPGNNDVDDAVHDYLNTWYDFAPCTPKILKRLQVTALQSYPKVKNRPSCPSGPILASTLRPHRGQWP